MAYRALGMIEVKGMLGAILAADAALKAADVELLGNQKIRGGLTTVQLIGDVSAVYAAVEAGVEVVKQSNNFIASHVIPRMDEQVERMLMKKHSKKKKAEETKENQQEESRVKQEENKKETLDDSKEKPIIKPNTIEALEKNKFEPPHEIIEETLMKEQPANKEWAKEELERMTVADLRSLAYKENILQLTKKEIKYANKETLIRALQEKGVKDK